ncbi:NADH:flavin oxidoreductase/NADH oxidase [soil metagenome]
MLFDSFILRSMTFRNRIGVSPMCQYSCTDGLPGDWHTVHLGARAVGGAGLVMVEATAVTPEGRISAGDAGIWNDTQAAAWGKLAGLIASHGAVPAIQLAHAGWKASTAAPWKGGQQVLPQHGGWQPLGVGDVPFDDSDSTPRAFTVADVEPLLNAWRAATQRAVDAGFKLIEIHAAHGYLLHSFLSPISNHRTDDYGGNLENRTRLLRQVVDVVRKTVPNELPLAVRLSCSDWLDGGWTIDDSVMLAKHLRQAGVDLIDCSSGGIAPHVRIPVGPGYQVCFAEAIRKGSGLPTAAVGMITDPHQAETILQQGQADMVLLAREMLRDPYWPRTAAEALGVDINAITPEQYKRAW